MFVLLSSYAYFAYQSSYKAQMIEEKESELRNLSRTLSDWVSGRVRELMILSDSDSFSSEVEYRKYLSRKMDSRLFDFEALWFISEDSSYWNTRTGTGSLLEPSDFQRYFSGELLFLYHIPEDFRYPYRLSVVIFAVPIMDGDRVAGLLGGSVPLSELRRQLRSYAYEIFDSIALVDLSVFPGEEAGGRIIAHDDEALIGRREQAALGEVFTSNRNLKDRYTFVTTLINNWKLVGTSETAALFVQLRIFFRFFILILVLTVIVISAVSIGISQLISNPILSLTDMVNNMIRGDFSNEITVRTRDELQSLAAAFNLLNRRNIQLRTDDRFSFLGRISSRMAHEIRHPLHVMQIAVHSMNGGNFRNMADIISHEIENADKFVREILDIAKPNELCLEQFAMSRLLESVHRKFELLGREKKITVELELQARNEAFYFDVLKIEQVFTNILTNSLEAVQEGDRITIRSETSTDGALVVTLADTGPGFSPDTIDRVFDPYFTTRENGTGLGLSICYQILAAHGAHIELGTNSPGGALTRIIFTSMPA